MVIAMPTEGFSYNKGEPGQFTRSDLERPVAREFCPTCGTHIATLRPRFPGVIIKVGTLDDPSLYGRPDMALYTAEKQSWHHVPDRIPAYEQLPPRA
jgi:hypothetical protein